MKRILYIISIAFILGGCSDFLDRPAHNMAPEADVNDIAVLSSSVYSSFIKINAGAGFAIHTMGELASDNLLKGSTFADGGGMNPATRYNQFQNFKNISPTSNDFIPAIWNGLYPVIEQANVNIRAINRLFPNEDPAKKAAFESENRCVRAWLYMFLVNTYGQVVLIPDREMTPAEYAELENNLSINELYEYIVADLRFAVENIPSKEEWMELYGLPWQGRAHLGTAQGLLAKALLYEAANAEYYNIDGADAIAEANYKEIAEIVSSMYSHYMLYDDYEKLFRADGNYSAESLFEIGTSSTSDGRTCFRGWRHIQPRNYSGYGFAGPTLNLINQYERDPETQEVIDSRYFGTVLFGATAQLSGMEHPANDSPFRRINGNDLINGVVNATGLTASCWPNRYCRKAAHPKPTATTNSPTDNFGGNNLKLLRWGEVLLIGAEAAYYADDMASAKKWLKDVRRRAGLDEAMVDGLSGQDLLDQIWKEKRIEIATEWSNRFFELVRIDKLYPGYMRECMDAKVNDEIQGIISTLDAGKTFNWDNVYSSSFPATRDNIGQLLPLTNGVQTPKNYTMPIPSAVFSKMLKVQQTQYYR